MKQDTLLELIWQNAMQPARGKPADRFRRMLKAMLPVHAACLSADAGIDGTTVRLDEAELMPALPLGDVLAEELGLDIPQGALIVMTEADGIGPATDLSHALGVTVGETLMIALRQGAIPLHLETTALYTLACAYDHMAKGLAFKQLGLARTRFRAGLLGVLGTYWSGARDARIEASGLFLSREGLGGANLRGYLKSLDAGFVAPPAEQIPAGLVLFEGGAMPFGDWAQAIGGRLSALLRDTAPYDALPTLPRAQGEQGFNLP